MRVHGFAIPVSIFIAFKFIEASSSERPPERNVIPGKAGTIVLDKVLTVYHAISDVVLRTGQVAPGVTILGLRRVPSIIKWCSNIDFITAEKTFSETSAHISIV